MPVGWTLTNYDDDKGVLRKRSYASPEMVLHRPGAALALSCEPIQPADERSPLTEIARKSLANLAMNKARNHFGDAELWHDPRYETHDPFSGKKVDVIPPTEVAVAPAFRSIVPPAAIAVAGAEAIEATFEQVRPGGSEVLGRFYVVWMRVKARPMLSMLVYSGAPGTFDSGLADARNLVRRLSFH
jgi:hypothetical protein